MIYVCKQEDAYVRDRMRWVVQLDNGETIFEDDDRPGLPKDQPNSAWIRLGMYCTEVQCSIIGMRLQFRSHVIDLPRNAPGYYLIKNAFAVYGSEQSFEAYIVGTYDGESSVHVARFKVPELEFLTAEVRIADKNSLSLILAKRKKVDRS